MNTVVELAIDSTPVLCLIHLVVVLTVYIRNSVSDTVSHSVMVGDVI